MSGIRPEYGIFMFIHIHVGSMLLNARKYRDGKKRRDNKGESYLTPYRVDTSDNSVVPNWVCGLIQSLPGKPSTNTFGPHCLGIKQIIDKLHKFSNIYYMCLIQMVYFILKMNSYFTLSSVEMLAHDARSKDITVAFN